jgi:hypothetical protein
MRRRIKTPPRWQFGLNSQSIEVANRAAYFGISQTPTTHESSELHTFPQVPQLFGSSVVFTHAPLQLVSPPVH